MSSIDRELTGSADGLAVIDIGAASTVVANGAASQAQAEEGAVGEQQRSSLARKGAGGWGGTQVQVTTQGFLTALHYQDTVTPKAAAAAYIPPHHFQQPWLVVAGETVALGRPVSVTLYEPAGQVPVWAAASMRLPPPNVRVTWHACKGQTDRSRDGTKTANNQLAALRAHNMFFFTLHSHGMRRCFVRPQGKLEQRHGAWGIGHAATCQLTTNAGGATAEVSMSCLVVAPHQVIVVPSTPTM